MKKYFFPLLIPSIILSVASCKKDVSNPEHPHNHNEVITTLRLIFTDSANTADVRIAEFRDPDGPGGIAFDRFDTIQLVNNSTYYTQVVLLDETTSPVDTVSKEVLREADEHLFCFTPGGNSASVTITDFDANNLPLGLQSIWHTSTSGNGNMLIQLKHQPGTKNGSCSPGETDVEVDFPVVIF